MEARTVTELRGFASQLGMTGYSKLKKAELLDKLRSLPKTDRKKLDGMLSNKGNKNNMIDISKCKDKVCATGEICSITSGKCVKIDGQAGKAALKAGVKPGGNGVKTPVKKPVKKPTNKPTKKSEPEPKGELTIEEILRTPITVLEKKPVKKPVKKPEPEPESGDETESGEEFTIEEILRTPITILKEKKPRKKPEKKPEPEPESESEPESGDEFTIEEILHTPITILKEKKPRKKPEKKGEKKKPVKKPMEKQEFIISDTDHQVNDQSCIARSKLHLQDWQKRVVKFMDTHRSLLVVHATGCGKCHGRDTPILMYDGSIKLVQDVQVGDRLMGNDSTPREVLSLARGRENMYRVVQDNTARPYTVNQSHILTLKIREPWTIETRVVDDVLCVVAKFFDKSTYNTVVKYFTVKETDDISHVIKQAEKYLSEIDIPDVVDIPLVKYLALDDQSKSNLCGFRVGVEFDSKKVSFDPYFVGLGARVSHGYIPEMYLRNSSTVRLDILKGLVRSYGYAYSDSCEVMEPSQRLASDIEYLVRSLGIPITVSSTGNFTRLNFTIPTRLLEQGKVSVNHVESFGSIGVEALGIGDYYGFVLDGNHRYLLGDFTVTHNTLTAVTTSQCYLDDNKGHNIVIIGPPSLISNFKKEMVRYGIKADNPRYNFYTYIKFYKQATAGVLPDLSKSLLIIDEAHNLRNTVNGKISKAIVRKSYSANKCLLLSATPFVNNVRDFIPMINILYGYKILTPARGDGEFRSKEEDFEDTPWEVEHRGLRVHYKMDKSPSDINIKLLDELLRDKVDYVDCTDPSKFPTKIEQRIEIIMTEEYYDKYKKLAKRIQGDKGLEFFDKNPTAFLNGLRRGGITLDKYYSLKILEAINIAKTGKTIIYSNWLEFGAEILSKQLDEAGLSYAMFTGKTQIKDRQSIVNKYNNNELDCLIITKAGGEGLDLKETRNIVILDPVWNYSLLMQIVGRAARYESHANLPEKDRVVNVYYLLLISPRNIPNAIRSADSILYDLIDAKKQIGEIIIGIMLKNSIKPQ